MSSLNVNGKSYSVNVDAATIDDPSRFSIPLAQPANGDLSLSITARRRRSR